MEYLAARYDLKDELGLCLAFFIVASWSIFAFVYLPALLSLTLLLL